MTAPTSSSAMLFVHGHALPNQPHGAPRGQRLHAVELAQACMTRPLRLLRQRWEQLQIDVRCALHAGEPERIQHYLLGGGKLARLGVFGEVGVQLHMTQTLLQTARDPEIPGFWRSACLECVGYPLRQLRTLLGQQPSSALFAVEQAVANCQLTLPMAGKEHGHGA